MKLIEGRECGGCTVCCVTPKIDQPEMQKQSCVACKHCLGGGCAVYDTRPPVCRSFYCAWRTEAMFDESWRPDKSGVMPMVETEGIPEQFKLRIGIGLMLVGNPNRIVRQKWFQDFVRTGIMNSVPMFLSLPGPRGRDPTSVFLNNEQMLNAIRRNTIKDELETVLRIMKGWDFKPVTFAHSGNDVSAPE